MDKATELREDIRRTEQQLSEVFRQFFIRNGHMGVEVNITQSFFSSKCEPEVIGGITDLSLKVTI